MLEGWVELEIIISPLIFVIYRVYSNHMKTSDSSVGTARLTLSLLRSPSKFRHYAQKPQYGLKWHKVYLSSWVINEKNKVPLFFPILTLPVKKTGGGANLAIHKKQWWNDMRYCVAIDKLIMLIFRERMQKHWIKNLKNWLNYGYLKKFLRSAQKNCCRTKRHTIWSKLNIFAYSFLPDILSLFSLGPKLNTKIGSHTTTTHHHKELLDQQYISCYWPDFDETLKVSSWEDLKQIPTVRLTFVQATFVLATFVHVGNISAATDPILTKLLGFNIF